jgi:hypothetical protein
MPRAWDKYGSYKGRQVDTKEIKQRFLIVCEGAKTEPNYFRGFRVPINVVVDIHPGAGMHTSVVRKAITILGEADNDYNQVWCVFDRDKNGRNSKSFNEALQLAKVNNISVAYTNDAFELWYLLHFNYHDTAILRHDYVIKLKSLIDGGYQKNDPHVFEKLESKMDYAIRNAKKLLLQYNPANPEHDDPSTTIHLLVEQLRIYL